MSSIKQKQGDTFEVICTYKDSMGQALNLSTSNITIRSQVRSKTGTLVADLVYAMLDQSTYPGKYSLSVASTAEWPIGILLWDIEYTQDGIITTSDPIEILVQSKVTASV
jgi:hypothetical protein